MRRIAVLKSAEEAASKQYVDGLLEGLQKKGWTVGRNLQIDYRWPGGDPARAQSYASKLAAMTPELILSSGTVSLNALRDADVKHPIVLVSVTAPVAGRFVSSLSHPDANVTGFTPFRYDIGAKWLQLLKVAVPSHCGLVVSAATFARVYRE